MKTHNALINGNRRSALVVTSAALVLVAGGFVGQTVNAGTLPEMTLHAADGSRDNARADKAANRRAKRGERTRGAQRDKVKDREVKRTRNDDGSQTRRSVVTGESGGQRDATRTVDRETGTASESVVITGAEGREVTRNSQSQRLENGRAVSTTTTGPDGQTHQRDTKLTRGEDGATRNTEVTGATRDGREFQRTTEVQRADGEGTATSTWTGADGNSVTREREGHWDEDTQKWVTDSVETNRE